MLRRDAELKSKWGTICPPVEMLAPDGKRRKTQAADLELPVSGPEGVRRNALRAQRPKSPHFEESAQA